MALLSPRPLYRLSVMAGLALLLADTAAAVDQLTPEIEVKAAFLPKFAAYVNWPPGALGAATDPVQICVIGQDPFGKYLDDAAENQRVDMHPIQIRRVSSTANAQQCNVAFLGGSAKQSIAAMQEALRGQAVLTITDADLGSSRGMVHFALKDGRVRFHIDDALAARSNLAISARLLSLAISVKTRTRLS